MMRNTLLAAVAALALLPNAGCLCGGFEGGGNQAYERNSEMMLICENGGFVASLTETMIEGRFERTGAGGIGRRGEDGQIAFELVVNSDGKATTTQLGETAWTAADLDMVALDHANVLCTDLEHRAWWNGSDGRAEQTPTTIAAQ